MNHNRKRSVLVWILVLLFLVFLLFPFYWMFVTSVKTDAEIYASPPGLLAKGSRLDNL